MSDFTTDLLKEAVIRNNELRKLVEKWRKEAAMNKRRSQTSKLPGASSQAITAFTLQECAKELEEALTK